MIVRTRIAPSPTGHPHIGTIYQALFNYAFAKKHNGSFIVRIEDTDKTREVSDSEKVIFSSLDFFSLKEDESPRKGGKFGPYRQSERLWFYHKYAQELISKGYAEFSYFPKEQSKGKKDYSLANQSEKVVTKKSNDMPTTIEEMISKKDWVVRLKVPKDEKIIVHDQLRGDIEFDSNQISSQVLIKSDGFPTYHLAVVVDDHLMQVSHIVRAEEWISSFPKHHLLYKYLNWKMPPTYHTATLRNPDKSKLSKREGHTDVNWYINEGFLPDAILNYLALLGWSHPSEQEIFTLDEFIKLFDLKDIRPIASVFDTQKLKWLNSKYIQKLSISELTKKLTSFYPAAIKLPQLEEIIKLAQSRMETLKDFEVLTKHFLSFENELSSNELKKTLRSDFEKEKDWNKNNIFAVMKKNMQRYNIKMNVLYKLLTGSEKGLPLPESLEILGKEETLNRLS